MNYTTNRVESLYQKLKLIGTYYASLLVFFDNLILSCSVISSEKDIKVIKQSMKVVRVRFDDATLKQYNEFLTPYIFKKVAYEYERIHKVDLTVRNDDSATMRYGIFEEIIFETENCTCSFFKTMQLPCRHIFKLRAEKQLDLFAPSLCALRWTKRYYFDSHPALNSTNSLTSSPISFAKVKVPEEISKFKSAAKVTKEINSLMSTLSTGQYTLFMDKLTSFRKEIGIDDTPNQVNESAEHTNNNNSSYDVPIDLSSSARTLDNSEVILNDLSHSIGSSVNCASASLESVPAAVCSLSKVVEPTFSESGSNNKFNVIEIRKISLPSKHIRIGRPKGSGRTVVGTKKKCVKKCTPANTSDRVTRSKAPKRQTKETTKSQQHKRIKV